jgi:O-antigen/teichoic acid export membrane protein
MAVACEFAQIKDAKRMTTIDFSLRAKRKKAVLWHVTGGWLSNIIQIIQGVLLIPLYLHYLGDRLYGFWLATGGVLALISMVDVGVSAVTLQRCAAAFGRKELATVTLYFWHGAVVMVGMLGLLLVVVLAVGHFVANWLQIDSAFQAIIIQCYYATSLATLIHLANEFMRNFAAALQRNHIPVFAQTFGDMVSLIGIVLALVVFELGLWALVAGVLLRTSVPMVINLFHTVQIIRSIGFGNRWSFVIFKDYMSMTPAILAAKSSGQLARHLPAVLITRIIGPEATVAYTVTMRVVMMVQSFINHALSGLYGACSHYFNDPAVTREHQCQTLSKLTRGYFLTSAVGVSLYALFNHGFISLWISDQQFAGQLFTCLAALASFILVRNNLFVGMGIAFGEIRAVEFTQFFEQLFRICLIVVGIYSIGLIGAPLAIIIAGLTAQFGYIRIFQRQDMLIAQALRALLWLWMPLVFVLLPIYAMSDWFVVDGWLRFILYTGWATAPFGLVFFFFMPGLKERILKLVRRRWLQPEAV